MRSRAVDTFSAVLIAVACGLVIGMAVVLACVHPRFTYVTLVGDDAGYYFGITRNFLLGHGFSYDRLHETNGFNPLEPLVLIPLFALLKPRLDAVDCYRVGVLATWVCAAAAMIPLAKLAGRLLDREGAKPEDRRLLRAAILLFYAGAVTTKGYYGMDAFFVLLLGLTYFAGVSARGPLAPGIGAAIVDGGLLGLLFLARVDSLPIVAVALAMAAGSAWVQGRGWTGLAGRLATFLAFTVPYIVWGQIHFGTWVPVSARMKTGFPQVDLPRSLDTILHSSLNSVDIAVVFVGLATAIGVALVDSRFLRSRSSLATVFADFPRIALLTLALGLGGRLAWLIVFSRFDVQAGYFILVYPFLALVPALIAARVGGFPARAAAALLALVAVLLIVGKCRTAWMRIEPITRGHGDDWESARQVEAIVKPGEVIFGGAFGMMGFISDRAWINGDGVANNQAYQDAIRDGAFADYLRDNHVAYVAASVPRAAGDDAVPANPFQFGVASGLYGAVDSVTVDGRDLVLESWSVRGGGSLFALFRYPPRSHPAE